jgi:hypothetical protein
LLLTLVRLLQSQVMMSNVGYARNNSFEGKTKVASASKAGVVPVHVDMVVAGDCFYFQRLLVVSQPFDIETTVRKG